MSHKYKDFEPEWFDSDYSDKSYRSVFKWGEKLQIKEPRESLYKYIKNLFGMTDEQFSSYSEDLGLDEVAFDIPSNMPENHLAHFAEILGENYVRTDD